MNRELNILFTSSGRRVSLIKSFLDTFHSEAIQGKIITADYKDNAPTAYISEKHYRVPLVSNKSYIEEIISICQKEKILLIVPLIDSELSILSKNKHLFDQLGIKILLSGIDLVNISSNKRDTYEFFIKNKVDTPALLDMKDLNERSDKYPLIIKPYDGSSSKGVTKVNNFSELSFFKDYIQNAIIQEFIEGEEYTVDVLVDFEGNIKTIVPRLRIETRAGEVSKGITKKEMTIINAVRKVIHVLPNPVGCLTLQCIKQSNGDIKFIEINPRFGGGIPLSIEAGANFPLWVIKMCQGELFLEEEYGWKENLVMLRYDDAVFMEKVGT